MHATICRLEIHMVIRWIPLGCRAWIQLVDCLFLFRCARRYIWQQSPRADLTRLHDSSRGTIPLQPLSQLLGTGHNQWHTALPRRCIWDRSNRSIVESSIYCSAIPTLSYDQVLPTVGMDREFKTSNSAINIEILNWHRLGVIYVAVSLCLAE